MPVRLDGIVLQVSIQCPSCLQPLHLQGLGDAERCPACGTSTPLPLETWTRWFGPAEIAEALGFPEGEARQVSSLGGTSAKYAYGHRMPRCQACKAPVPEERLPEAAAAGSHPCACGESIRVRPATGLALQLVPGSRYVVNEGPGAGGVDAPEASPASSPVMFACMACGGSLTVDGRERTVACSFCGGSNYLPDGLWLRLHPPRTVRPFFVVLDKGTASRLPPELVERLSRADSGDARKAAAASADASEVVLERLASDAEASVRAAVAANPRTSVATVERLVGDPQYRVRGAAAGSGRVSAAVLAAQLKDESDRDVLEAVGRLGTLDPTVIAALAGSAHTVARRVAAAHPSTPDATLVLLAADPGSEVIAALSARETLPPAAILALAGRSDEGVVAKARARPGYAAARWAWWKWRLVGLAVVGSALACAAGGTGVIGLLATGARLLLRRHH